MEALDVVVIGAGLNGMRAALERRQQNPELRVAVIDALPWPGADVRSQRSNGFVCELGPFAFERDELTPHLQLLSRPPRPLEAREAAGTGWLFDGTDRQQLRVAPTPHSFPTGCEDLVQAYRRELADSLRLSRAVTTLLPADGATGDPEATADGFELELGGEVPTRIRAAELIVATGAATAGRLLGAFDPGLAAISAEARRTERAFAWFGCMRREVSDLRGYGMLPHPDLETPIAELIFCTEVFDRRAMPDRFLIRAETADIELPDDDDELLETLHAELCRWTGVDAAFGFRRVHRFDVAADDGIETECRVRLAELERRVPGLRISSC